MELSCDVLVVGGGCGGVAAALAVSDLGREVVLTEAGSRVGGQLTSQAVPPDEHPWVETLGITADTGSCGKPLERDTSRPDA
jgi:heterodisulfide reductase subunit A-like polyferredoxin